MGARALMGATRRAAPVLTVAAAPLLFALCVLVTVVFWVLLPVGFETNENSDYLDHYEPVARNILAGHGISLEGRPTFRTPPGYSLLLAGLFGIAARSGVSEDVVLSGFTLLCMGGASVLLFSVGRTVWGPLPALGAALLWMTYPFTLWLTKQPNAEVPYIVVLYAGFHLFWCALIRKPVAWVLYFVSGLLFGLAMLIHPIAIGTGLVLSAVVGLVRRDLAVRWRLGLAGVILLGNVIAVMPWEAWIYAQTGEVLPLSTQGQSMRDGLVFAVELKGFRSSSGVPQDVLDLMQELSDRRDSMRSLSGIIVVMGEQFRARPVATIKLIALKIVRSWYGTDSRRFELQILALQIPYLALILYSSWRAWQLGGTSRQLVVSIWALVLYFWLMTAMVVPLLRYMTPGIGLLFLSLSAGLVPGTRFRASTRTASIAP